MNIGDWKLIRNLNYIAHNLSCWNVFCKWGGPIVIYSLPNWASNSEVRDSPGPFTLISLNINIIYY